MTFDHDFKQNFASISCFKKQNQLLIRFGKQKTILIRLKTKEVIQVQDEKPRYFIANFKTFERGTLAYQKRDTTEHKVKLVSDSHADFPRLYSNFSCSRRKMYPLVF